MSNESLIRLIKSRVEDDVLIAIEVLKKMKGEDLLAFFEKNYIGGYDKDMVIYGIDLCEDPPFYIDRCYYKKGNIYLYIYDKGITVETEKQMKKYTENYFNMEVNLSEDY